MAAPYLGTFLGMPMQQCWEDLALWERLLNEQPVRALLEIGTGSGAFSTFLLAQCRARRIRFLSFDILPHSVENAVTQALELALRLRVGDVWTSGMIEIDTILRTRCCHPLLVFCDGGDKRREVRMFAGLLEAGDLLAAHDWGTEIGPGDVRGLRMLEPVATGKMTQVWRIKDVL